jgi:outer membrane lipoprotein-sorting protein
MKKLSFLVIFLLFIGISVNLHAQTIDEVINKHIESLGGLDKLSAIKTMIMTGTFGGGGMEFPVTMTFKRDNKVRMDITFQGNSQVQAFDGTTAWQISPWQGKKDPEKMPAEGTKSMKEMADFEGQLVNYKQKGYTAELMGKEDMEGSEVYKIKLTDKDNDVTYFFLDTQSYLILKQSSKRKIKEKEIEQEVIYGNYQSNGGVMMAMSMEIKSKGEDHSQKGTITKCDINPAVDDAIFVMPEPKK